MLKSVSLLILAGLFITRLNAQTPLQKCIPVDFSRVEIRDAFWTPKLKTVATATLDACVSYTANKTGRIRNFEKAAKKQGKHEGIYYDDSDVYKALEAIAYSLKNNPDPALEAIADSWIDKIAAAQLPDGYLNTYYILTDINQRWTDMSKHETYCAGHLIEAGIAYYNTTGKDRLLQTGIRFAEHIDSVFRLANRHWAPGHQEIELALMRLYHHTGEDRYLKLADWFLQQRGGGEQYNQNKLPLIRQRKITGHAVRAMYMYTGAADVAAVTGNPQFTTTMDSVWADVVGHHLYITGGIGAQASNEGFGQPYDLPNATAYCETCASVGMVFWNQRMQLLSGQARYTDLLERSLYNGALDGLSLSGDRFFYGNPLASKGDKHRREWFGTACCPSNIARLVASVGNYIYASSPGAVWVNLFIGSRTQINIGKTDLGIEMLTDYPWKGNVRLRLQPSGKTAFQLRLRIPGWLKHPVDGNLYYYTDDKQPEPVIKVNGKPVAYTTEDGYAILERTWKKGDELLMELPMEVRKIKANNAVLANANRTAIQYGPIVYCVESSDDGIEPDRITLPAETVFEVNYDPQLLGGVNTIAFQAPQLTVNAAGNAVSTKTATVQAIPYFSWNNRGNRKMQVWLPETFTGLTLGQ
ncbi:glycoside hydrolase family 127 protein [Niabella terrae]